jgi:hypothetical protein
MPEGRRLPSSLRRPGLALVTRSFEADLKRLSGSNEVGEQTYGDLAYRPPGSPDVLTPDGGAPRFHGNVAVGSGPLAERIVQVATSKVRDPATRPTRVYHPGGPTVACASFVSTVLQEAGAFQGGDFTRWCPDLPGLLRRSGAVEVVPPFTPKGEAVIARMSPGDVILFSHASGRFRHTGIYIGGFKMIDTSSSQRLVVEHNLITYPSYRYFSVWRFTR